MKNKWLWGLFIAVIVIGFFFVKGKFDQKALDQKNAITVSRKTLKETLSLSGTIDASQKTTLRFPAAGKITWIGVKEGDSVKKYQIIAEMDQRSLQDTLSKYLNTYLKSRWEFDQIKDNYKDTAVSTAMQRILDEAQFDLNNTVSDVQIQSLALEYSKLSSPIDGIVTKVTSPIAPVNIYLPTQAEFDIVNPKTIYFAATADQTDVINLKKGMTGKITLDSYPDATISATITDIAFTPKVGETGTVYEVKMSLSSANNSLMLRLGMTGDVDFTISETPDTIVIPTKYIKTGKNQEKYVFVLEKDQKIKRPISVSDSVDSTTAVTSGLSAGEKITL